MRFKCFRNDFRSRTSHPRFGMLRQRAVDLTRTECSRFCERARLSNKCDGSSEGRHPSVGGFTARVKETNAPGKISPGKIPWKRPRRSSFELQSNLRSDPREQIEEP